MRVPPGGSIRASSTDKRPVSHRSDDHQDKMQSLREPSLLRQTRTAIRRMVMSVPIHILWSLQATALELPTSSESHNILRIILLSDLAQPCQVSTVHLLQWCPKERIIGVRRCILQVLAIFYPGRDQRRRRGPQGVCHILVHRFVGVPIIDVPRKDCARAVWWVCRRTSVREDVGLEWLTRIYGQYTLVLLAQSFAPELRGKQRNGFTIDVSPMPTGWPLTLVSLANASRTGCV